MTKPDLGTKRLCADCGARFFDLGRDPIHCPKCQAIFNVPVPPPSRPIRFVRPFESMAPVPVEPIQAGSDDDLPEADDDDDTIPPPLDDDDDEPVVEGH